MGVLATSAETRHVGFISLIKDIARFSRTAYFPTSAHLIAAQEKIQKDSYEFIRKCFSEIATPIQGNRMLLFVTKIDVTEIGLGIIDLSSPNMQVNKYDSELTKKIFNQNEIALSYLLQPFSEHTNSRKFGRKLDDLIEHLESEKDPALRYSLVDEFLRQEKSTVDEVLLFSQILSLICVSQSIYAFSYQIKCNANFAKLLEVILKNEDAFDSEHAINLSMRYSSVFIGNLAARVFCDETLQTIESAFIKGKSL